MQKWIMFVLFVGASVLGVYLMTLGLPEKPVDEAADLPEGHAILRIKASDFQFDQAEYRVNAGDKVKIILQNTNGIHGIEIANTGITLDNNNNESDYYEFTNPGTYELFCNIACGTGHADMRSVIIVE